TQVFVFTALWLLLDRDVWTRARVMFTAGLFLGALQMVRIDALALLIGIPLLFAVASLWSSDRDGLLRGGVGCAAGLLPGIALGFVDLRLRSPQYFSDLRGDVKQLLAATVASLVITGVIVFLRSRMSGPLGAPTTRRRRAADGFAVIVAL